MQCFTATHCKPIGRQTLLHQQPPYVSWFMLVLGPDMFWVHPSRLLQRIEWEFICSWGCQVVAGKKAGWKKRNWLTETLADRLLCLPVSVCQSLSCSQLLFAGHGVATWICDSLASQSLCSWPTRFERRANVFMKKCGPTWIAGQWQGYQLSCWHIHVMLE